MTTRFDLVGDVAVVTGAARGLGRAIARAFLEEGAQVLLADISPHVHETAASLGPRAKAFVADVTKPAECEAMVEYARTQCGTLDMLVCNAAIDIPGLAVALHERTWDRVLDVNLKGYFLCAQSAGRAMMAQRRGGSIVMISSFAATHAVSGIIAYNAAKGGVNQLVRTLAIEWASAGIRVNGVAPGYLENVMEGMEAVHGDPATEERIIRHTPLGRRAKLEEIAAPVLFLSSRAASYVTGSILAADGGYTAI